MDSPADAVGGAVGVGPARVEPRDHRRIELQTVFSQLIPRFPEMRLAVPVGELRFNTGVLTGGLLDLPVNW